jgi:hypothetical protein
MKMKGGSSSSSRSNADKKKQDDDDTGVKIEEIDEEEEKKIIEKMKQVKSQTKDSVKSADFKDCEEDVEAMVTPEDSDGDHLPDDVDQI